MFKYTFKQTYKRLSNSILFSFILVFILIALLFTVILKNGSDALFKEYYSYLKPNVTIFSDISINNKNDFLSKQYGKSVKELSQDEYYNLIQTIEKDIKPNYCDLDISIDPWTKTFLSKDEFIYLNKENDYKQIRQKIDNQNFNVTGGDLTRIVGVSNPEFTDIKYFENEIVRGRTFTKEELESGADVIILPQGYLLDNGEEVIDPMVGDTITLNIKSLNGDYFIQKDYLIIGKSSSPKTISNDSISLTNSVIVPINNLLNNYENYNFLYFPVFMELNNIEDLIKLSKYIKEYDITDLNLIIKSDVEELMPLYGKIKMVQLFNNSFFLIAFISSVIMLNHIFAVDVSKREKEIALIMSLGCSKKKLIGNIMIEYVFYCLLSYIISLIAVFFIVNRLGSISIGLLNFFNFESILFSFIIVIFIMIISLIPICFRINTISIKELCDGTN